MDGGDRESSITEPESEAPRVMPGLRSETNDRDFASVYPGEPVQLKPSTILVTPEDPKKMDNATGVHNVDSGMRLDRITHANNAQSSMFANSPPLEMPWGTPSLQRGTPTVQQTQIDNASKAVSKVLCGIMSKITIATIVSVILFLFYSALRSFQSYNSVDKVEFNKDYFADFFRDPLASMNWMQFQTPQWMGFVHNGGNINEVLGLLPFALFASCVALGVAALAIYYTRPREISCDDKNLILEGSGPMMIGVRWKAIKQIQQSRTWDLFNGKRDVLTVETMGGHSFRLRVADIVRGQDIGTFMTTVRTSAPNAVLEIADEIRNSEPSYTELWLKYFSAPLERNKKGLLEPGMALDSGRYRIVETVGGGGQGTAYLATCIDKPMVSNDENTTHFVEGVEFDPLLETGKEVVLKEYVLPVHKGQGTAEKTAAKLKAEGAVLRQLNHPQIVKLLDGFIEDYRGYLVLEYVKGETLKNLVDRLGPQPEEAVIDWALQIADILTYLHTLSPPVVHRDITPDNIILQEIGQVKIVDFNVAHQVDSSATATVVGKHSYIPPEQFRGKPSAQSDIYALGGTMFYLLTGTEPEPISVSRLRRDGVDVSEKLDAIVAKCTSLDLTRRYETAADLAQDLRKAIK